VEQQEAQQEVPLVAQLEELLEVRQEVLLVEKQVATQVEVLVQ
jgi:hypothetical protein